MKALSSFFFFLFLLSSKKSVSLWNFNSFVITLPLLIHEIVPRQNTRKRSRDVEREYQERRREELNVVNSYSKIKLSIYFVTGVIHSIQQMEKLRLRDATIRCELGIELRGKLVIETEVKFKSTCPCVCLDLEKQDGSSLVRQ